MNHVEIQTKTVTSSSQAFTASLLAGAEYIISCSVDFWWKLGGAASVSGADCVFVGAGVPYPLKAHTSQSFNIIQDTGTGDGRATLSRVKP